MTVFSNVRFAFHREFPKESWKKGVLFRVLKKLVIKSDFQHVRFVNRVKFDESRVVSFGNVEKGN